MIQIPSIAVITVLSRYIAVYFLPSWLPRDTHSSPVRARYGCLSGNLSLTEDLPSNSVWYARYRVMWYCDISRFYSTVLYMVRISEYSTQNAMKCNYISFIVQKSVLLHTYPYVRGQHNTAWCKWRNHTRFSWIESFKILVQNRLPQIPRQRNWVYFILC